MDAPARTMNTKFGEDKAMVKVNADHEMGNVEAIYLPRHVPVIVKDGPNTRLTDVLLELLLEISGRLAKIFRRIRIKIIANPDLFVQSKC